MDMSEPDEIKVEIQTGTDYDNPKGNRYAEKKRWKDDVQVISQCFICLQIVVKDNKQICFVFVTDIFPVIFPFSLHYKWAHLFVSVLPGKSGINFGSNDVKIVIRLNNRLCMLPKNNLHSCISNS